MWLGVTAGMVTVITAAMRTQEAGFCKGYQIKIKGFKDGMLFTSEEHITDLLKTATGGEIEGQRKSAFDLPLIEDLLEQSSWVYNADLYFDNNDILHANVTERKPLARVFTNKGESFYIDEAGKQIPLSDKVSLDLPVFTGYPSKKIWNQADSSLVQNVIATASFINNDPFWTSQVAQIDIHGCGADCWNMEMIPVVGSHKVKLGDGSDIASKFHRLYLFYDQVLKRTGFDKYQKIDVQYGGQVIAVKDNYSKVDSLQLRKNIEDLLQQSREYNEMVQVKPNVDYLDILKSDSLIDPGPVFDTEGIAEEPDSVAVVNVKQPGAGGAAASASSVKSTPAPAVAEKDVKESVRKTTTANGTEKSKAAEKKTAAKKETTKNSTQSPKKETVIKKQEGKQNLLEKKKTNNKNN